MKTRQQRPTAAWLRILQGLALFLALIVILPWLGGKMVPHGKPAALPAPDSPAQRDGTARRDGTATGAPDKQRELPALPPQAGAEQSAAAPGAEAYPLGLSPEEVDQLPQWQRDVLHAPGWRQPVAAPVAAGAAPPGGLSVKVYAVLPRGPGGGEYQAQAVHMNDGLGCLVRLKTRITGGKPDAQGRYKACHWAFGDGQFLLDPTPYNDDTLEVMHFFAAGQQAPQRYVVRVQVIDAAGASVFADSLPIVLR